MQNFMNKLKSLVLICLMSVTLSGCIGALVGAAVDTTIEVAKVPFKVAGAVVDVAKGDGKSKKKSQSDDDDE